MFFNSFNIHLNTQSRAPKSVLQQLRSSSFQTKCHITRKSLFFSLSVVYEVINEILYILNLFCPKNIINAYLPCINTVFVRITPFLATYIAELCSARTCYIIAPARALEVCVTMRALTYFDIYRWLAVY